MIINRGLTQTLTQINAEESKLLYSELSYKIRGACFELRKELGWGHKEVIYQRGLEQKLIQLGLNCDRERQLPVKVDGKKVGVYIPDLVVEEKIMIEIKAKEFVNKYDITQFWQYLRISSFKLGFLINFGSQKDLEIIRRVYDTARFRIVQRV